MADISPVNVEEKRGMPAIARSTKSATAMSWADSEAGSTLFFASCDGEGAGLRDGAYMKVFFLHSVEQAHRVRQLA